MTIIRVPISHYVSPQDATDVRCDSEWHEIYDDHDNRVEVGELAGSRKANPMKAWLKENYPI